MKDVGFWRLHRAGTNLWVDFRGSLQGRSARIRSAERKSKLANGANAEESWRLVEWEKTYKSILSRNWCL